MSTGLGIISGTGALPRLIAEKCKATGRKYLVVAFKGASLDWSKDHPNVEITFEKQGKLFKELQNNGCTSVCFAGAMQRPQINPIKFDGHGMKLISQVLSATKQGDDASLRIILEYYEAQGFSIEAAHQILPDIVASTGVLTQKAPNEADKRDGARAFEILEGLGTLDLGQGAVVARKACLGLETVQGTDEMLKFVSASRAEFPPNAKKGAGILYKAPKPGQELRVDMPTIGADTIRNAHAAGLSGVIIAANTVMIINRAETISVANELGLFIWSRENHE